MSDEMIRAGMTPAGSPESNWREIDYAALISS